MVRRMAAWGASERTFCRAEKPQTCQKPLVCTLVAPADERGDSDLLFFGVLCLVRLAFSASHTQGLHPGCARPGCASQGRDGRLRTGRRRPLGGQAVAALAMGSSPPAGPAAAAGDEQGQPAVWGPYPQLAGTVGSEPPLNDGR